jgi:D-alanyl-lipoteichoic acid acyltransferase DltB (MBOAT superfamily)
MKKLLFITMILFAVLSTNAQQTVCVTLLSEDTLKTTKNHVDYYTLHDSLVRVECPTLYALPIDSIAKVFETFDSEVKSISKDIYYKYMVKFYTGLKRMEADNIYLNDYLELEIAIIILNQTLGYEE